MTRRRPGDVAVALEGHSGMQGQAGAARGQRATSGPRKRSRRMREVETAEATGSGPRKDRVPSRRHREVATAATAGAWAPEKIARESLLHGGTAKGARGCGARGRSARGRRARGRGLDRTLPSLCDLFLKSLIFVFVVVEWPEGSAKCYLFSAKVPQCHLARVLSPFLLGSQFY